MVISAFFVVLIGPSRIYLGAHWVTDLSGAYLIEVALLSIALLLYLQLDKRGVLAMHKKLLALIEKIARSKGHRPAQP